MGTLEARLAEATVQPQFSANPGSRFFTRTLCGASCPSLKTGSVIPPTAEFCSLSSGLSCVGVWPFTCQAGR